MNKQTIATDRSQSQRLLRCGMSADTADMSWNKAQAANRDGYSWLLCSANFLKTDNSDRCVPAWSLSKLLGLIPHTIEVYDGCNYYLSLAHEFPGSEDYHAAYKYYWADDDVFVGKRSSCPIEACVQLIEWLAENNYKLNEQ